MRVVDGYVLNFDCKIIRLPLEVNNYAFKANFYVVSMRDTDCPSDELVA